MPVTSLPEDCPDIPHIVLPFESLSSFWREVTWVSLYCALDPAPVALAACFSLDAETVFTSPVILLVLGRAFLPSQLTGFLHGEQNIHPRLQGICLSQLTREQSLLWLTLGRSIKFTSPIQLFAKVTSDLFMSRVAVFSNDRIPVSSATSYHMDKLAIQRPKSLAKDSFKKTRAS